MQIFLDSADIIEINEIKSLGILDGVTTNPSLFSKTSSDFYKTIKQICNITEVDVSIEVIAEDFQNMIEEGKKILSISDNIVVKLPLTWDGLKACKYFYDHGKKINMTLCCSVNQALLAAKMGATYVSPFVGRMEDQRLDGIKLIKDIRTIYDRYAFSTKILASSIRNIEHVEQVALCGADVMTATQKIIKQLVEHPITTQGLEIFKQDWSKSSLKI